MRTIAEFAAELVRTHQAEVPDAAAMAAADLEAGEFEVAAISIAETAAISADELDELERLAADFDEVDKRVATVVIAKRRSILAA